MDVVTNDPFHITGPALISFSGGRTSAYMLWRILQAHSGSLADDVHVTFANTGKERDETLRFVHECATRWGVRVRWLEWRTRRVKDDEGQPVPFSDRFEEVGFNSASRNGEPFAHLIAAKGYAPNAVTRFCTTELKIRVMKHFMQAEGYDHWTNVIGLRADEPRRVARALAPNNERWTNSLPLATAGISERDVLAFWKAQDFDLQLRSFEGNCDMCFLKSWGKLCQIEAERPGSADWWKAQEAVAGGRFVTEYSYAEIQDTVQRQGRLFDWKAIDSTEREHDVECGAWCAGA